MVLQVGGRSSQWAGENTWEGMFTLKIQPQESDRTCYKMLYIALRRKMDSAIQPLNHWERRILIITT